MNPPDEIGIRALCWDESGAFVSFAEDETTVTGTTSVDVGCFFGQLVGGGVRDVSTSSVLVGNRPLDQDTWRVTVSRTQGSDPIKVYAVCLQPI